MSDFISLFTTYYIKYIDKIRNQSGQNFRRKLVEILKWDQSIKYKEFKRFLKWCTKRQNLSEDEVQKSMDMFFNSIMINNSSQKHILSYTFYKCLKRVAKLYYEESLVTQDMVYDTIELYLYNLLPFEEILNNYTNNVRVINVAKVENHDEIIEPQEDIEDEKHIVLKGNLYKYQLKDLNANEHKKDDDFFTD